MEGQNLNAFKHVKNISKKQATFARIYSIMKKTHKNLTKNELEIFTDNTVGKTITEFYQRKKSYTVPDFTDIMLAKRTQGTDEDATQTSSQDNNNLIGETQLQDERYEITDKDITETCDIATKFKLFEEFQACVF